MFAKEADPYTANESMVELIDQIRARNFEIALNSSLGAAGQRGSLDEIKAHTKATLGDWYIKTHGVNTTSKVEDMCTLLEAYWDVATKRLVDNVCMTLEHDFTNTVLKLLEEAAFLCRAARRFDASRVEARLGSGGPSARAEVSRTG